MRPRIILLHALGCHRGWWTEVGQRLEQSFDVIAPDLRGHGTAGAAERYTWDGYASDVEALIAQHPGPTAIVGHSMGGYIGLSVAARQRVELKGLVVVDMKTRASSEELAQMREAAERPARPFPSLAEAVARYRLSPPEELAAERIAAVAADSFRQAEDGSWLPRFDRRALAIEPLDAPALAVRLRCPSLWLRGEHSQVMERAGAEALARVAGGEFQELAGQHHHLPLSAPELLSQLVDHFLRTSLSL